MGNNLTPVVRNLLIINLVVFAIDAFTNESFAELFGLRYFAAEKFQAYQILTYMFIHSQMGIMHIFGNMFALFVFGPWLERSFGAQRFLAFYIVTGIGAGLLNAGVTYVEMSQREQAILAYKEDPNPEAFVRYLNDYEPMIYSKTGKFVDAYSDNPDSPDYKRESVEAIDTWYEQRSNIPTVGASGAIFGILAAFALLFPNVELFLLFFPFPIKAKYFVAIYVLYELYAGLNYAGASNVAHFAHLGGALIGFLLIKYWGIKKYY